MSPDDHEANFQEDRRKALAGTYEAFLQHKRDYPGVYNFSRTPWASDPEPPEGCRLLG